MSDYNSTPGNPPLTVGELLVHLRAGRRAREFESSPGVNTLCNLSLSWFGTHLTAATFIRLRFECACRLGLYMDGADADGIDDLSVTELAVALRAVRDRFRDPLELPIEVIEEAAAIVRSDSGGTMEQGERADPSRRGKTTPQEKPIEKLDKPLRSPIGQATNAVEASDPLIATLIDLARLGLRGETRIPYKPGMYPSEVNCLFQKSGDELLLVCLGKLLSHCEGGHRNRSRKPDLDHIRKVIAYKQCHTWDETDDHFHKARGSCRRLVQRAKKGKPS